MPDGLSIGANRPEPLPVSALLMVGNLLLVVESFTLQQARRFERLLPISARLRQSADR